MPDILRILFFLVIIPYQLRSQILPREGGLLNYRLIGFSVPLTQGTVDYKLEIAAGNYDYDDSFEKNTILTLSGKSNKIIAEVPAFGHQYTWRMIAFSGKNNSKPKHSTLHHFTTGSVPNVDTNNTRFRIIHPATAYKDDYVFLDGTKALYDMNGKPVWYLPGIKDENGMFLDIKLSPQGTITYLYWRNAYEVNYNGRILWKTQFKGTWHIESPGSCHHEFTRLDNGHYFVLGSEFLVWPPHKHGMHPMNRGNNAGPATHVPKTEFGTLVEYDKKGNIVWTWKSSSYFTGSDLRNYLIKEGDPHVDVHENSFYFDEKAKTIYIGFKGISRIIKIKYPQGTVLNTYGEIYKQGIPEKGNGLFCDQHCCRHSPQGYVYMYNNNSCSTDDIALPTIPVFREPKPGNHNLEKIWEYKCTTDGLDIAKQLSVPQRDTKGRLLQPHVSSGGSVDELPGNAFFVSMSGPFCKVFIVNRDKQILWSALPEKYNADRKEWVPVAGYRASIITHKQIEQLIWNTANDQ